ncbi:Nuclear pore membrane glycoprotein 210-like protein [Heterocephalus glaber]|uniref:Nuclear pore membrane glycoprotein 210-like protein n=1 Tax=Heterocephalus glaber TaxID=10181 RepID=G5BES7_HETGA|nr:Nuclear pore membrane glycoprotein 210-like protein [Heterocephalus glaber]
MAHAEALGPRRSFCSPVPGLLWLLPCLLGTRANKLNVPQVLLPFGQEPGPALFLLEAERGCYAWHSTHDDVVTVEPLYENGTLCSQRAVLIAESTQPVCLSSVILAREIVTDHELHCDVKVDVINSIEIVSRTRKLYVDDSPLELMVRALDAEGFTISSGDRWSLEVGQVYTISVEVFDKSSKKVYISDNLRITCSFLTEYFEEQLTTVNGSYHVIKVLKAGVNINGSLTSIIHQNNSIQPIKVLTQHQQEVVIYFPIKLTPASLAFPHHPLGVLYHYQVQAEGDSGNFTWTSSNDTVAVVTTKGVVTSGRVRGKSTVWARAVQNPYRCGEMKIIEIRISMYHVNETKQAVAFTDCSHLPMDLDMDKQGVFILLEEGMQRPGRMHCTSVHIVARSPGHTLVTVQLSDHEEHLQSSATFAAYEPLQVLTFRIGNHPGVLNPSPAVEAVQVRLVCAHPASVSVTPVYTVPAGIQLCPLLQHSAQLIPISNLRDTVLELTVFDRHRRKFDNFSSLILEWKSSNETLAHFEDCKSVEMVAKDDGSGQARAHGHQILKVHQIKGTVFTEVNFVGYSEEKSPKGVASTPRSAALGLLLVEDVTVRPESATIYNHPNVQVEPRVQTGQPRQRGFVSNSGTLVPVRPGFLTLEVCDLCLAFSVPAKAHLRVSDIQELELDLIDKVEIGRTVFVTVRALNSSKRPFRNKYFRNMELRLQLASAIATLTLMEEQDAYSENYVLQAIAIGQTTLVAAARDKTGRKFTSAPRHIEVTCEGSPQPQSVNLFSSSNQSVAVVNRRGQVTGRAVGTAVVYGSIQTVNEDTGKVIVFSQDEVQIEVVRLRSVRIVAATTQLITDAEMPVYVMGVTSTQSPFSFSNAHPGLTFHWSLSKMDVLDLVPRHSEVSLQLPEENNFAMVVHTKAPGRTSIRVTIRCVDSSSGQFEGSVLELSDEIQILVSLQLPEENNFAMVVHTKAPGRTSIRVTIRCVDSSSGQFEGSVLELSDEIQILVAPVTYLLVSSHPRLYTAPGRTLSAFPVGMALTFIVQFYSSIGEKFHTHSTQLYLSLNRNDLLLIGPGSRNYTYTAQAVSRGLTLVGLWDQQHPCMADYIPVALEYAIEPDTTQTSVGDVVCFSTHLVSEHGEPGMWMISDDSTLQTDVVTGVGVARSPGTAMIFYDIPGVVRTYREVTIKASSRLTFTYDLKNSLTNSPHAAAFKLFITTGRSGSCTPNQALAITKALSPETLVLCHVQFSNTLLNILASKVFHVHSDFSVEKGVYVCPIKVRPQSEELRQALSVADTSVYGQASLHSDGTQSGIWSAPLPFTPAFYINQLELLLSHRQAAGALRVQGVDRVLHNLQHWHSPGLATYPVLVANFTALQQMAFPVFINISCSLTSQQEAVVVRAEREFPCRALYLHKFFLSLHEHTSPSPPEPASTLAMECKALTYPWMSSLQLSERFPAQPHSLH